MTGIPCWFCGDQMIWGCDFTREDYGLEGDGIVANFSCPGCGAGADMYSNVVEEDDNYMEEINAIQTESKRQKRGTGKKE